jgi:hypothetical protein
MREDSSTLKFGKHQFHGDRLTRLKMFIDECTAHGLHHLLAQGATNNLLEQGPLAVVRVMDLLVGVMTHLR